MCAFSFVKFKKMGSRNPIRAKKRILSLFLTIAIFTAGVMQINAQADSRSESKEEAPAQLYAQAAVLMDADSGRVLYGKNESEVMPMASTTKIMTCILALEYGNLDDIV